jgi:hypothetical protein
MKRIRMVLGVSVGEGCVVQKGRGGVVWWEATKAKVGLDQEMRRARRASFAYWRFLQHWAVTDSPSAVPRPGLTSERPDCLSEPRDGVKFRVQEDFTCSEHKGERIPTVQEHVSECTTRIEKYGDIPSILTVMAAGC